MKKNNNNLNGVIVVNKSEGLTSRDVVNILNQKLHTKAIGHIGTLDPLATGVLVCLVGKYTKLSNILINHDKEYIASFKLGVLTDTLDITGTVLKEEDYSINENELKNALQSFIGEYQQEVPKYSAVKVNGKKLYEYARQGKNVILPKKKVIIYSLELLDIKDNIITIKTKVSKGTYIRSLIRDIGEKLNTYGTMTALKRTTLGNFTIKDAYSLEDIENDNFKLKTLEDILDIETVAINDQDLFKIKNGQVLNIQTDKLILFKYQGNEISLYQPFENGKIKPLIMF
jgi:tRNA pseudouridine55 synthase